MGRNLIPKAVVATLPRLVMWGVVPPRGKSRLIVAILATGAIVLPVASATAGGAPGRATATAIASSGGAPSNNPAPKAKSKKPAPKAKNAAKQLAALRSEAESLARRVAALKASDAALAAAPPAPTPAPIRQSIAPASGPAGGDLAGSYPEPTLAAHSVSVDSLLPNSVGTEQLAIATLAVQDFAPGSVGTADVADRSIPAAQVIPEAFDSVRLAETFRWPPEIRGPNVSITLAPGAHGRASVTCPNGTRLLSGGFFWKNLNGKGTEILNSSPGPGIQAFNTWEVVGKVMSGGTENTLTPVALCLE